MDSFMVSWLWRLSAGKTKDEFLLAREISVLLGA